MTVGVTLYILSIGDLSEKFMDFTFDMASVRLSSHKFRNNFVISFLVLQTVLVGQAACLQWL